MADDIRTLGGLRKEEIEALDEKLKWKIEENKRRIEGLEKAVYANGRPCLEDRMRAYVDHKTDQVSRHTSANMSESDQGVLTEISQRMDWERTQRDIQHKENMEHQKETDKTISRMERVIYLGLGGLAVLRLLMPGNLLHLGH